MEQGLVSANAEEILQAISSKKKTILLKDQKKVNFPYGKEKGIDFFLESFRNLEPSV